MELEVGLLLAVGSSSGQNGPLFLCGRPFLAVYMADLVVEALGKPHNRPFWLHGSLSPWFWKALEPAIACVGVATYVK